MTQKHSPTGLSSEKMDAYMTFATYSNRAFDTGHRLEIPSNVIKDSPPQATLQYTTSWLVSVGLVPLTLFMIGWRACKNLGWAPICTWSWTGEFEKPLIMCCYSSTSHVAAHYDSSWTSHWCKHCKKTDMTAIIALIRTKRKCLH